MINIPLSILWIYGIVKEKTALMLPTIIADALCLVFLFVLPALTIYSYLQIEDRPIDDKITQGFAIRLSAEVCTIIFVIYLYIVEISLYRVMVNKNKTPAQNQPIQYDA